MVQIIDVERQLKVLWPIARLELWLQFMRESEFVDKEKVFERFDINWEPYLPSSQNTSILNTSVNDSFNDYLNCSQSNHQSSRHLQPLSVSCNNDIDTKENDFKQLAILYINNIQRNVGHLLKLCQSKELESNDKDIWRQNLNYAAVREIHEHTKELSVTLSHIKPCLSSITDSDTQDENVDKKNIKN